MEHKHITVGVIVLVLIIAGMFIFAYIKSEELKEQPAPVDQRMETDESPYSAITRIDAKHFFIGKTHTLVGEIVFPTPCDLLNWNTKIQESFPEVVTVQFDVVNHADECAQTPTAQRFKVSFDASEQATIKATLQGRPIPLNLIPGAEGETPDDFELFIKG